MAGRVPQRPRGVSSLLTVTVEDEATQRALDALAGAVQKLLAGRERQAMKLDLLIGINKIRHGLGRAFAGYTVTPTFATIAFGHALSTENPHPELELWVDVVGSDQFGARLEVW